MKAKCSFCGRGRNSVLAFFKPQSQVQPADVPQQTLICDRCIESCHQVLASKKEYSVEAAEKQQLREWLNDSVTETLVRAIVELKHRDALIEAFSQRAQLAEIQSDEMPQPEALQMLPAAFARENRVLPWRIEDSHLVVGFYNPLQLLDIYDELVRLAGMPVRPALISRERLREATDQHLAGE